MSSNTAVVRAVSWHECCHWLILLRVFRTSIAGSLILLSSVGALIAPIGWHAG